MAEKEYNAEKLHKEFTAAGLAVSGVTSDGRIDWSDKPTKEMLAQAEQILADHTAVSEEEILRQSLRTKGLDNETMLFALWEKVMEGSSASAETIQAVMNEVKTEMTTK